MLPIWKNNHPIAALLLHILLFYSLYLYGNVP